jgi:hypothetical protein
MSREFLTNINLNKNELQNAAIQSLNTAPSSPVVGQIYFDTAMGHLRQYDGSAWLDYVTSESGAGYITSSDATNFTVTNQELFLNSSITLGGAATSSYGQITLEDAAGNVTFQSGTDGGPYTIAQGFFQVEYPTNGYQAFAVDSGAAVTSVRNVLNATNNDGYNTVVLNGNQENITFWNANADANAGFIGTDGANGLSIVGNGEGLALATSAGADIQINPDSTVTWFNNNLTINGDSGTISTDVNSLHLNASNGVITTDAQEFHTTKVELWNGGDTSGSRLGVITAHPTDGSLTVAASNQLILEAHSGDIYLAPQSENVYVGGNITTTGAYNITAGNNVYAGNALYVGGADSGNNAAVRIQDAVGNNVFTVDAYASGGYAEVDLHGIARLYAGATDGGTNYGSIGYDGGNNLVITANNNDVILNPDSGYAYIGSNTDSSTRIATWGHVSAVASGLSVLGSVRAASEADIADLTAVTTVGGVTLANADRVLLKAQNTATQNGIYIYNLSTTTLVASTDPVDLDIKEGSYTLVEEGTYAAQGWIVTAFSAGASTWTQFSAAGEYTAGDGIDISGGAITVKLDSDSLAKSGSGLKVNLATNGGLNNDGGLYIVTGAGLALNGSNQLVLDTEGGYGVRKYATSNGALTATSGSVSWIVNHALNTRDVTVQVFDNSTYAQVEVDVVHTDANNVTLSWASTGESANAYRVVVVG